MSCELKCAATNFQFIKIGFYNLIHYAHSYFSLKRVNRKALKSPVNDTGL